MCMNIWIIWKTVVHFPYSTVQTGEQREESYMPLQGIFEDYLPPSEWPKSPCEGFPGGHVPSLYLHVNVRDVIQRNQSQEQCEM